MIDHMKYSLSTSKQKKTEKRKKKQANNESTGGTAKQVSKSPSPTKK